MIRFGILKATLFYSFLLTTSILCAQWQVNESPRALDIIDMHVDASGNAYGVSYAKGVYLLSVSDNEWSLVNEISLITDIAGNSQFLFAIQQQIDGGFRVLRSSDNGVSWSEVFNQSGVVLTFYDLYSFGNTTFFSSSEGFYVSNNNGTNWVEIIGDQIFDFKESNNTLYGAGVNGLYEWDGTEWVLLLAEPNLRRLDINDDVFYGATPLKVIRGVRSGMIWNSEDFSNLTNTTEIRRLNNDWFFAKEDSIFITTTDTLTIFNENIGNTGFNHLNIFNGALIAATTSGPYLTNGQTGDWTYVDSGLPNTEINQVFSHNNNLYAATANGVFVSEDQGVTWIPFAVALPGRRILAPPTDGIECFEITTFNGQLALGNWKGVYFYDEVENRWVETIDRNGAVASLLANNGFLFFTDNFDGVYRFNGVITEEVSNGLGGSPALNDLIATDTAIFVATGDGGIFYSQDNGSNWALIPGTDVYRNMVKGDDSRLLLGATNSISTLEQGNINEVFSDNQAEFRVFSLDSIYVAGTQEGNIFISDDFQMWYDFNEGLDNSSAIASFAQIGTEIYVSTSSDGIFSRSIDDFMIKTIPDLSISYTDLTSIRLDWSGLPNIEYGINRIDTSANTSVNIEEIGTSTIDSFLDTNVTIGTNYLYFLSAKSQDEFILNDSVVVQLPEQIVVEDAQEVTDAEFRISWETDPKYVSFTVFVSDNMTFTDFLANYDSLIVNDTTVLITGLRENTSYSIQVEGNTALGRSGRVSRLNYAQTDFTLSVEDNLFLTIHPNPSHNKIRISGLSNGPHTIRILNTSGKVLYSQLVWVANKTVSIQHNLPSGLYFLDIPNVKSKKKLLIK